MQGQQANSCLQRAIKSLGNLMAEIIWYALFSEHTSLLIILKNFPDYIKFWVILEMSYEVPWEIVTFWELHIPFSVLHIK